MLASSNRTAMIAKLKDLIGMNEESSRGAMAHAMNRSVRCENAVNAAVTPPRNRVKGIKKPLRGSGFK